MLLTLAGLFAVALAAELPAQVLARPGWAGSGVAPESWWRHAVFYRVDPARFQVSASGSTGDLAGIAQRLDYLQSLGVDALVLDPGSAPNGSDDLEALGDLIRAASQYHLRLLLSVTPAMQLSDQQKLIDTIRGWLSAGAAGVLLPRAPGQDAFAQATYGNLVSALSSLLRSSPGERVLLSDPAPETARAVPGAASPGHHPAGTLRIERGAHLTTLATLPVQPPSAAGLRASLTAMADAGGASAPGLVRFAEDPPTGSPDAAAMAAILLAAPGTAVFDFGDEIGLDTFPAMQASAGNSLPVMQWTPMNVQEAAAPIERAAPTGSGQGAVIYGAYHPYTRPPPRTLTGAAPRSPQVTVDGNLPATLPDPNTLPGFTTGSLPNPPVNGKAINVTTEDRDPGSLLNAYRQLIALHHGNAALRNGTELVLNHDAQDVVVWVRRAPAGSRTAASVLVAVNLGAQPVSLSLDGDLAAAGIHSGALRSLFSFAKQPMTGETTGALRLPPYAVFVGALPRGGVGASPASRPRR